jgi:hypothetical protein
VCELQLDRIRGKEGWLLRVAWLSAAQLGWPAVGVTAASALRSIACVWGKSRLFKFKPAGMQFNGWCQVL